MEIPYKITLKAARVNADMTLEDAAKALKKNKQTVSNWENGKTSISALELQAICKLYEVPIDYIFLPLKSS